VKRSNAVIINTSRNVACSAVIALLSNSSSAAPPQPITGLQGKPDGLAVELSWDPVDTQAIGVLVERCLDPPQASAEPHCEAAAVLQADARSLRHIGLRPWRFRSASFNADGLSAPSDLTASLGEHLALDLGAMPDLPASASRIAALIRKPPETDAGCTDPTLLLAEGHALVAAHADFDGYRLPADYCGTGGCIYVEFRVDAEGCYRGDPEQGVLAAAPPWPAQPDADQTRQVCGSGSAREGRCWLYQDGARVDEYAYRAGLEEQLSELQGAFNPDRRQTPVLPDRDWGRE
jgi:hypothetical protein